jgi:hypothetical protein
MEPGPGRDAEGGLEPVTVSVRGSVAFASTAPDNQHTVFLRVLPQTCRSPWSAP